MFFQLYPNSILILRNSIHTMYLFYFTSMYSHLYNKREVTLTDFEKFHPTQIKNPPYMFIDFLDFSTLHSTFIRFIVHKIPKNPILHVYSSLQV